MTIYFPSSLPQDYQLNGFQYAPRSAVIRTQMDAGLPKVRNRYTSAVWDLRGTIIIATSEKQTFDYFFERTLANGSLPFVKKDPWSDEYYYSWQFTSPPVYQPFGCDMLSVSINLERIPGSVIYVPATTAFVTQWRTTTDAESITLPLYSGGTYSFTVDWGDGSNDVITAYDQAEITHEYAVAGNFYVSITGTCSAWYQNNDGDRLKVISLEQWGDVGFTRMINSFYGCSNMALDATDIPDFSSITDMTSAFRNCYLLDGVIAGWDVSNVTSFVNMFRNCSLLNDPPTSWDTGSATTMNAMFYNCAAFDQDISGFDVSSVTTMVSFLYGAQVFSSTNYDALLNSMAGQTVQSSVTFDAPLTQYTPNGEASRLVLTGTDLWTITDAGLAYERLIDGSSNLLIDGSSNYLTAIPA